MPEYNQLYLKLGNPAETDTKAAGAKASAIELELSEAEAAELQKTAESRGAMSQAEEVRVKFTESEESLLSERLLKDDMVESVQMAGALQRTVQDMLKSLDMVIWVLIISAGLLAFVVLYNLNNINITERRRELATLKVLGFYDGEVAAYVYRENIYLTVIGIGVGVVLGIILHRYVILTCEIDMMMFGRNIRVMSYGYSVLITVLFSLFVNLVMFFRLRKIDMVESLKSVE
ncbi:MAG: ABC transporter permease [Lachnospiraceae bacterium]|nr:ABC transporter permease [Lachnospiraceae bacterium]